MSNPYVQVELDALYKKAPLVASALGLQHREAVGGLVLMWAHIYSGGGAVTPFYLRTFFGVDGHLVAEALVELGFIEASGTDGQWRVKGAGRYTRLTELRREAGRAGRQKQLGKTNEVTDTSGQNAGKHGFAHGLPGQTPGKRRSAEVLPGQASGKSDSDGVLPGQKRALEPRDLSLYERERDLENGDPVEGARERRPPPDGGGATRTTERSDRGPLLRRTKRPPRPREVPEVLPLPGTPEWDEAVAESKRRGWG